MIPNIVTQAVRQNLFIKTERKYHIDDDRFSSGYNGQGLNVLYEPVPNFFGRPGDGIISAKTFQGVDNNAVIIFGRDRNPLKSNREGKKEKAGNTLTSIETVSGFSDHMGAGAIDIIVGRGAPYPAPGVGAFPNSLPPLYLTKEDNDIKSVELRDGLLHPGYLMDAARIYISQMSDIDDYFSLKKVKHPDIEPYPHSSIMLKADRLRMHARRDIKIVAGGDKWEASGPRRDSNGFIIGEKSGIHLIAGNGEYGEQQPIPVGDNLVQCFRKIIVSLQSLSTMLHSFMESQGRVNAAMKNHWHGAGPGPTTTPDPFVRSICDDAAIDLLADMTLAELEKTVNIPNLEKNFLKRASSKFINSKYNTTT